MSAPGYTLQTLALNGSNYVVGYDAHASGAPLPDLLQTDNQWYDGYGNPRFLLNPDGTVVYATIAPTAQQVSDAQVAAWVAKATPLLLKIIVQGVRGTLTPLGSWQAIDAALRAILT